MGKTRAAAYKQEVKRLNQAVRRYRSQIRSMKWTIIDLGEKLKKAEGE